MMRNHLFLLIFSTISLWNVSAQVGNRYGMSSVRGFTQTTTLIVLDNTTNGKETPYNIAIQKAANKYWKITPFVFKRYTEIDPMIPSYGFSMLFKSHREVRNADNYSQQVIDNIALVMCDRDSITHYGSMNEISKIDLTNPDDAVEVNYKLPVLIRAFQNYVAYISKSQIDFYDFQKGLSKFCNKRSKELKKMKLYLCEEELPKGFSANVMKNYYKLPFEVVKRSKLTEIIDQETENAAILHFDPNFRRIWVFSIKDGDFLYMAGGTKIGDFTTKDMKKLYAKAR